MQFKLTVELGNAAMQTDADLADALSNVIDRLDRRSAGPLEVGEGANIRDANGSTVGRWEITT